MRIVFMGTPPFAVPSLEALLTAGHNVCGVFTQPDKPKNRGMKLQPSPVKEYAVFHHIPVFQPAKMRDGEALGYLKGLNPDLIAVAAYGKILPAEILELPPFGCINVHSSLLPKYRGAAPINWAILNGEKETGVTIMYMAPALDAGDIISTVKTSIDPNETAPVLTDRLSRLGAGLLVQVLDSITAGTVQRSPQEEAQATYAPMLSRELSALDWSKSAEQLHNQVRGLLPWPAAVAEFGGIHCKVFDTMVQPGAYSGIPGTVLEAGKQGILIACGGNTALWITALQADGGKQMRAADYLRGHPVDTNK